MIDNLGGTDHVNNFLTSLNIKPINAKSLIVMERRAGSFIEKVSEKSTKTAAKESFKQEMKYRDVSNEESMAAKKDMGQEFENLGTNTTISRLRRICVKKWLDKNHGRLKQFLIWMCLLTSQGKKFNPRIV
ncbi:uncharacterized protein LOC111101393 [Crassostrea virginica]